MLIPYNIKLCNYLALMYLMFMYERINFFVKIRWRENEPSYYVRRVNLQVKKK